MMTDYPGDGSQCECCGIGMDVEPATCGHFFCFICRGRGHDEDCDGEAGHTRLLLKTNEDQIPQKCCAVPNVKPQDWPMHCWACDCTCHLLKTKEDQVPQNHA